MKKFWCNLIVPALMFGGLLSLPLWADKSSAPPSASSYTDTQTPTPTPADPREIVVGVAESR